MARVTGALVAALVLIVGAGAPAFASNSTSSSQILVVAVLGGGRVTSTPAGISCPKKCKAAFPQGTSVQLTAKTENGTSFQAWGGSCTGAGQCTVDMTSLAAVAAQFSARPPRHAVKAVAVSGLYSGSGLTFWVAPNGRSMVSIGGPDPVLQCTPSGAVQHLFTMLRAPIAPNGSFHTKVTEQAVVIPAGSTGGVPVKITYSIAGNFQAATANSPGQGTGTWQETLTSTNPSLKSCDSNSRSWSATLSPGGQSKPLLQSGNYKGPERQNTISFSVNSSRTRLLNVALASALFVHCSTGTIDNSFQIAQVPIKSDGSFSVHTTTHGVVTLPGSTAGTPATITSIISGYFMGLIPPNNAGWPSALTAGGILRQNITFATGAVRSCTSNNRAWGATLS